MGLGSLNPGCRCDCCPPEVHRLSDCEINWECQGVETRVIDANGTVLATSGSSGTFLATAAGDYILQSRSSVGGPWVNIYEWTSGFLCGSCGNQLFGGGERLVSVDLTFEGVSSVANGTYSALATANSVTIPLTGSSLSWEVDSGSFVCLGQTRFYETRFLISPIILSRGDSPPIWRLNFNSNMQMRTRLPGGVFGPWNGPWRFIDFALAGCLASWEYYIEDVGWDVLTCPFPLASINYGSSNLHAAMSIS